MSIIRAILFALLFSTQGYNCSTALTHVHNDIRDAQIQITSWSACSMVGTINGVSVSLWADGSSCPLHSKVPGLFYVRYDFTCKQVLDLSDAPIPVCSPSPTPAIPTPTPTPTPSPTPVPTPRPTPSPTPTSKQCKPAWKPCRP